MFVVKSIVIIKAWTNETIPIGMYQLWLYDFVVYVPDDYFVWVICSGSHKSFKGLCCTAAHFFFPGRLHLVRGCTLSRLGRYNVIVGSLAVSVVLSCDGPTIIVAFPRMSAVCTLCLHYKHSLLSLGLGAGQWDCLMPLWWSPAPYSLYVWSVLHGVIINTLIQESAQHWADW